MVGSGSYLGDIEGPSKSALSRVACLVRSQTFNACAMLCYAMLWFVPDDCGKY